MKTEGQYHKATVDLIDEIDELETKVRKLWTEAPGVGPQFAYVLACQRALGTAKHTAIQAETIMSKLGWDHLPAEEGKAPRKRVAKKG